MPGYFIMTIIGVTCIFLDSESLQFIEWSPVSRSLLVSTLSSDLNRLTFRKQEKRNNKTENGQIIRTLLCPLRLFVFIPKRRDGRGNFYCPWVHGFSAIFIESRLPPPVVFWSRHHHPPWWWGNQHTLGELWSPTASHSHISDDGLRSTIRSRRRSRDIQVFYLFVG